MKFMKLFWFIILSWMFAFTASAYETWTDPNTRIKWTYTVQDDGTVSLGGGSSSDTAVSKSTTGDLVIPSSINGKSVTSIGSYAFEGCSWLESVTIPSSVTSIGSYAFYGCSWLESVTIPSSVTNIGNDAFSWCRLLKRVNIADLAAWCGIKFGYDANPLYYAKHLYLNGEEIQDLVVPDGVTSIERYAFSDCSGLTSVTIPSSVTSIGSSAFSGCSGLTSVTIPSSVRSIGEYAFYNTPFYENLPNGMVILGSVLYEYKGECPSSVTIPEGVTSIGDRAFYRCSGLTSVTIPSGVTSIGYQAFLGCGGLTSVTIPSSVTSIGGGAFYGCSGLTSVTIPSSVTSIGSSAFEDCSGLKSVTIPEGVTSIGGSAFSGCSGLTSVTIPSSVTSIGSSAFEDCSGLTSVTIPSSVTSIGDWAFAGCSGLTSMTLPFVGSQRGNSGSREALFGYIFGTSSYTGGTATTQYYSGSWSETYYIPSALKTIVITDETRISYGAFYNCSGLTSVTIPSSVTSIGENAFYDCANIKSATLPAKFTMSSVFPDIYANMTSITIPADATYICDGAFSGCSKITSIDIPPSVTRIGNAAFSGCSGLTMVTIPTNVTRIGSAAFSGCAGLAVNVTDLAAWCGISFDSADANPLYYTKKLYLNGKEVIYLNIPQGVGEVKPYAFYNCNRIMSVSIPTSVTRIGELAFYGCSQLTSMIIPSSVKSIGGRAFSDCSGLTSVTIPTSVTSIGASAFYNCRGLTSMTIPASVTSIGAGAFTSCSGIKTVTMPGWFTLKEVFPSNYSSIQDATILAGEKVLGKEVFAGCSGLKTVVISEGVTTLGEDLFSGFWSLKEVTLPSTITSIGGYVFDDCFNLWTIHVSDNGDIEALKQMLYESGFDTTGVTFDHVSYCKVQFDSQRGVAAWTETQVVSGGAVGELPPATREGYEFLGWWTSAVGGTQVTAATVVTKDVTFYAQWKRIAPTPTGDDPEVFCEVEGEYGAGENVGEIPVEVVNVDEPVKITVKGLPSGVKFKDGMITGAPKKSGVYAATVTVKPASRGSAMAPIVKALTFVVRNPGEHVVVADYDAAQGSVKGMGVYAPGKKVTLKATAAKGWVFSGWYDGDVLVSRLASYVLTMPNDDVRVTARFVTVAEDKESIGLEVMAGDTDIIQERTIVVKQGMYVEWPVAASALSATTVKVSGLPSGLKFTAKDMKIAGTPKSASKTDKYGNVTPSKVKITVTTAGKQKQEYVVNVTVRAIPAVGTFNGGGEDGIVTLTVAKTGKLSGKWLAGGKTWKLSASGFDTWDDDDRLTATLAAKCGKEVMEIALAYENGCVTSSLFKAYRNGWKEEPLKTLAKTLKGWKVTVGETDNIELTVGASGAVKAKGTFDGLDGKPYSASCSTVLIPTETANTYLVYLYFPPKAGKFGGLTDLVVVLRTGVRFPILARLMAVCEGIAGDLG